MRVGLVGASGFIGKHLRAVLTGRGDEVVPASLRDPRGAAEAIRSCDAVVNLAGEPIAQRWTRAAKDRMRASRIEGTRALIDALARGGSRPKAYISASAVGYYPPSETATYTEASPHGDDFLGQLCAAWESEAERAAALDMRVAIVRTGITLATDGGALMRMLPSFHLGFAGVIGSGRQWLSWVHIDDVTGIYCMAIDGASGTFNATAPQPVTNYDFTKTLATVLHRPVFAKVPSIALRVMLGEGADVLLTGARVLPQHTLEAGYMFRFTMLDDALRDLLIPR
jgi:uncharacterized protein